MTNPTHSHPLRGRSIRHRNFAAILVGVAAVAVALIWVLVR